MLQPPQWWRRSYLRCTDKSIDQLVTTTVIYVCISHVMSASGPSDQNVILGIISDFLHTPFRSFEDPLDLWFHELVPGTEIKPFSIGYSVGMGK